MGPTYSANTTDGAGRPEQLTWMLFGYVGICPIFHVEPPSCDAIRPANPQSAITNPQSPCSPLPDPCSHSFRALRVEPSPPITPDVIQRDESAPGTLAETKDKKERQCFFRKTKPKNRAGAIKNTVHGGFASEADPRAPPPHPAPHPRRPSALPPPFLRGGRPAGVGYSLRWAL
jgi:hypothetical protein